MSQIEDTRATVDQNETLAKQCVHCTGTKAEQCKLQWLDHSTTSRCLHIRGAEYSRTNRSRAIRILCCATTEGKPAATSSTCLGMGMAKLRLAADQVIFGSAHGRRLSLPPGTEDAPAAGQRQGTFPDNLVIDFRWARPGIQQTLKVSFQQDDRCGKRFGRPGAWAALYRPHTRDRPVCVTAERPAVPGASFGRQAEAGVRWAREHPTLRSRTLTEMISTSWRFECLYRANRRQHNRG